MAGPRHPRTAASGLIAAVGVALVLALGLVVGPATAATAPAFTILSRGDRGTDVLAVQLLFRAQQGRPTGTNDRVSTGARNPVVVPLDGIYGDSTASGVRFLQGVRGLTQNGLVDAATWGMLAVPLTPGIASDAVAALQAELRAKRGATMPADGTYGASTTAAVKAFQAHVGLPATGAADTATWRALLRQFELPTFSTAALCDYSVGNGAANWGTSETVATLEAAGAAMVKAGYGRIAVGDLSFERGGDIPDHETHEVGLDADIRPMRKANDQCTWGTRWSYSTYDRAATRALIGAIRAATPGHVKLIYFNDPQFLAEGLTTRFAGHDDHLHVRICAVGYPDRTYRC